MGTVGQSKCLFVERDCYRPMRRATDAVGLKKLCFVVWNLSVLKYFLLGNDSDVIKLMWHRYDIEGANELVWKF